MRSHHTPKESGPSAQPHALHALAFSPEGGRLVICGSKGVGFWDMATHETVAFLEPAVKASSVRFPPDGKRPADPPTPL